MAKRLRGYLGKNLMAIRYVYAMLFLLSVDLVIGVCTVYWETIEEENFTE